MVRTYKLMALVVNAMPYLGPDSESKRLEQLLHSLKTRRGRRRRLKIDALPYRGTCSRPCSCMVGTWASRGSWVHVPEWLYRYLEPLGMAPIWGGAL